MINNNIMIYIYNNINKEDKDIDRINMLMNILIFLK